jgi:hypothetical protein
VKKNKPQPSKWQTTGENLIRYKPSGTYYARVRAGSKLNLQSLKTDVLSVAKLRLSDFEKNERQGAENRDSVSAGRVRTFSHSSRRRVDLTKCQ